MSLLEKVKNLHISDYNYPLPDERIARHPLPDRDQCKLLAFDGVSISDHRFSEVPELLPSPSTLIYNDTRVINARLRFRKPTGSAVEIFCLDPKAPADYQLMFQTTERCTWHCLVGNSKRWKEGDLSVTITVEGKTVTLTAHRNAKLNKSFEIEFSWTGGVTFASVLEAVGEIPIPPYLNRGTEASDSTDYQTVYSHFDGSVAAPTAGLHFTQAVLDACDRRGIERHTLTLHVGAGTFQPVKSEDIGDHDMHFEFISVERSLIEYLLNSQAPVIAVGTTSVRTLESLYYIGQILHLNPDVSPEELVVTQWMPYTTPCQMSTREALQCIVNYLDRIGSPTLTTSTQLMIAPGFTFRIVDGMITNFHQPQSTLLLLVSAFVGEQNWHEVYRHALDNDYRFLSYGDACLFTKQSK